MLLCLLNGKRLKLNLFEFYSMEAPSILFKIATTLREAKRMRSL